MPEEVTEGEAAPDRRRVLPLRRPSAAPREDPEHLIWAYQSHVTAIYQYLYSRVGNRADAEDLTSNVFMKAIGSMRSDVSTAELRAWLYRVAQTTLADHWREFYAEATNELEDDIQREAQTPENHEAVGRVETLLSTLPEHYRRVLELRFLRGYSVRETARELELSESNVKVLQFRALNRAGRDRKGMN
jgi:RNA polymerase sigma-70 factor (ECF subfamily)